MSYVGVLSYRRVYAALRLPAQVPYLPSQKAQSYSHSFKTYHQSKTIVLRISIDRRMEAQDDGGAYPYPTHALAPVVASPDDV